MRCIIQLPSLQILEIVMAARAAGHWPGEGDIRASFAEPERFAKSAAVLGLTFSAASLSDVCANRHCRPAKLTG